MKSLKFLMTVGAMIAVLGQSAWANSTPHIYITGSTAFRTAALAAIAQALGITGSSTPPLVSGGGTGNDTSISGTGKTTFIFEGGSINSVAVTVCATFTGSESGIQTCTGSIAVPFLNDSDATSHPSTKDTNNASAYSDVQGTVANPNYTTHIPDFCFSDVFQTTTPFTSANPNHTYVDTGNDNQVGIVTFKWMASNGFPLNGGSSGTSTIVSNYSLEPNLIQQIYSTGVAPLSMFSGNSADRHVEIFAAGRNPDSGTRATALADSGYGVATHVVQYQATINGSKQVTSHVLYPIETIAGISTVSKGNSGEATGGNLKVYMTASLPPTGLLNEKAGTTAAFYVTYLGTSDAASVEGTANGSAVELLYKGVQFSIPAIYDGHYTFWSYEHIIDRGDLSGNPLNLENSVVTIMQGYATTSSQLNGTGIGINDPLMQVSRTGDGQLISPNFSF